MGNSFLLLQAFANNIMLRKFAKNMSFHVLSSPKTCRVRSGWGMLVSNIVLDSVDIYVVEWYKYHDDDTPITGWDIGGQSKKLVKNNFSQLATR